MFRKPMAPLKLETSRAVPKLAAILDTSDDRIIRAVLEAITCIGSNTVATLPAIRKTTSDAS